MSGLAQKIDSRSPERVRAHYEIERALADRLRAAGPEERTTLYGEVYDELFARVPDHPQVLVKRSTAERAADARSEVAVLARFLEPGMTVMEIGAGDCAVSRAIAERVTQVHAIDVSAVIAAGELPANVCLHITDGRTFPLPDASVDVVYSNQLLEHLHPDDALLHAREARRVLKPGGRYVCMTPNRLNGPHDISGSFDEVATGFHLKEYSTRDLRDLFDAAGFARTEVLVKVRARTFVVPAGPLLALERGLERLPASRRRAIADSVFVRKFLGRVVATA